MERLRARQAARGDCPGGCTGDTPNPRSRTAKPRRLGRGGFWQVSSLWEEKPHSVRAPRCHCLAAGTTTGPAPACQPRTAPRAPHPAHRSAAPARPLAPLAPKWGRGSVPALPPASVPGCCPSHASLTDLGPAEQRPSLSVLLEETPVLWHLNSTFPSPQYCTIPIAGTNLY